MKKVGRFSVLVNGARSALKVRIDSRSWELLDGGERVDIGMDTRRFYVAPEGRLPQGEIIVVSRGRSIIAGNSISVPVPVRENLGLVKGSRVDVFLEWDGKDGGYLAFKKVINA